MNCGDEIAKQDIIVSLINELKAKDENPLDRTEILINLYFDVLDNVRIEIKNCAESAYISSYAAAATTFDMNTFFNDINVLCKHNYEMKDFIDSKLNEVKQIAGGDLFQMPHFERFNDIIKTLDYYDSKINECVQKALRLFDYKTILETVNLFK
uniref:Uncharacterized protein n=1 Tax=Strongyloides papillosus TaxID=174720 RepID=A0A0N5B5F8_STREA